MDSGYGVVLRYIDEDNFMVFMVEDRPSKALVRAKVEGEWKTIYSLPVPGDSFQFGEVNRITVIAEGPKIKLIVDDKYYGEFKDFQFGFGKTGLGIELDDQYYGLFSFDNFELRGPVPGAAELIDAGEILARQGVIDMALSTFEEAQASDLGVISANAWNTICWFGSLWGYAAEVMDACETAVALDPEHGDIRESRGVARAIMGDYTGAIEDFNFYVEWTKEKNEYGLDGQKREAWITELENGRNPFDVELLESLKHDK
jgi:tetratricopeptide (TPR) repeat protein